MMDFEADPNPTETTAESFETTGEKSAQDEEKTEQSPVTSTNEHKTLKTKLPKLPPLRRKENEPTAETSTNPQDTANTNNGDETANTEDNTPTSEEQSSVGEKQLAEIADTVPTEDPVETTGEKFAPNTENTEQTEKTDGITSAEKKNAPRPMLKPPTIRPKPQTLATV